MITTPRTLDAVVTGVFVGNPGSSESREQDYIDVTFGGIIGDGHFGVTRMSGARDAKYARGIEIFNDRQLSAVSEEELHDIANALDITRLAPEWLSANLCFQGVPSLTLLPPATRIYFSAAVLVVTGENEPCSKPGKMIQPHYAYKPEVWKGFKAAAIGKRGILAYVEREGRITKGDHVRIDIPSQRIYSPPTV
ncbi:MOSC domain-containing protein [Candidatus Woesearchaeota archaeon]|nr:MOSC domain-containing protein [Candidatus Woesearchaeota archaeon]